MLKQKMSVSAILKNIQGENTTIGAGNLKIDGIDNFIIIEGKFKDYNDLRDLVVKHEDQDNVYLRDVADVSFTDADTTSYARQNGQPVVMLDVKKRAGGNIINAIDQLKMVVEDLKNSFPNDMSLTYTNDQSVMIRSQISNLENSIVFELFWWYSSYYSFRTKKCAICGNCHPFFHVFIFHFAKRGRCFAKYYGIIFISTCLGNAGR